MASQTHSKDTPRDAISLLEQDHRTVEDLLQQFEEAEEGEHLALAEQICQSLTVHAQIEEELLYPAAKEALAEDEEEVALVYEAAVEHDTAKDLIARIEAMTEADEEFKATVKVLGEYIKHHVKEEEDELFPALEESDLDLEEIGMQLSERKRELMEELGIKEDEEKAKPRARAKSPRGSKSRAHGRTARH
jgi:hemerythrin-like domain-containing protein